MVSVSVLLPVRNAGSYLAPSLASLRRQTWSDLEVVAVDDGSTDGSGETLDRVARMDRRIRVIHTPARGLPAALNVGLSHARGAFIARHDADDLSHRRRLELQRGFLLRHRSVAVVGSRVRLFPDAAVGIGMRRWEAWHNSLLSHDDMASEMLVDSALTHGTSMMRRTWLERIGGWADKSWPEDLDLWLRLLERGARLAKLPLRLYAWRQHAASATRRDPRYARERFDDLRVHALQRGILRQRRRATLVGVGSSLRRWHDALRGIVTVDAIEARAPGPALLARLAPPVVLVFGAAPARHRWRAALVERSLTERVQFIFVA